MLNVLFRFAEGLEFGERARWSPDDGFGFSGERIGLGHQGLLFMFVELRCGLCEGGSVDKGVAVEGRERPFRQRSLYATYARRLPQD